MPFEIEVELTDQIVWESDAQEDSMSSDLILMLHTLVIESAPGALDVSIVDAGNTVDISFEIDGIEVFVIEPDSDGGLDLATVPVPDLMSGATHLMQPGVHELVAIQGSSTGSADFTIINPPELKPEFPGNDAPPVAVPAAVQPTGFRRWVLQDLAPGGLGSWIMPMNPQESEPPIFERNLGVSSTVTGTTHHISETEYEPAEWTFSGPCPTEGQRNQLEAYSNLNRRFYLHDHRGRAWKVVFVSLELIPRLSTNWERDQTEEFHDYTATVMVTDAEWVDVP